jgi:hypothetical protein
MRRAINLNKNIDMEHEILDLIDRYWKFDDNQQPVSNWHDKQDLLEAVRKALRTHDVSGLACKCGNQIFIHRHSNWIECIACNKIHILQA